MRPYQKAYYVSDFRRFEGWSENVENLRPTTEWHENLGEYTVERTRLEADDILYLGDDYVVRELSLDEDVDDDDYVIFDRVTDEWKAFCHDVLEFEVPSELGGGESENPG